MLKTSQSLCSVSHISSAIWLNSTLFVPTNSVCIRPYYLVAGPLCFTNSNQTGNPDDLVERSYGENSPLKGWREQENLKLLNLVYDLTPMSFVSLVITDVGLIPPTSVPVVLREYSRAQK